MEYHQPSTPPYFRYTIRLLSRFPNFDQPWIGSLRTKAVHLLQLPKGGRALDVGCGTGGSFPYLRDAVGETGEVVGVEISPDVARAAERRIDVNHWSNVKVVVGDARTPDSGAMHSMLTTGSRTGSTPSSGSISLVSIRSIFARRVVFPTPVGPISRIKEFGATS